MSITSARKLELIKKFAKKEGDTGSPEVQCAILSDRTSNLTNHFKTHKKIFILVEFINAYWSKKKIIIILA